ncbi:Kinesin- protein 11 [Thoreauomyces humboldtii]|nr:Kinesin- protein 11 [Thoreauomyces humboldtii]
MDKRKIAVEEHAENIRVVVRCRPASVKELLSLPEVNAETSLLRTARIKAYVSAALTTPHPNNTADQDIAAAFPVHCDSCDATVSVSSPQSGPGGSVNVNKLGPLGIATREFAFDEVLTPSDDQSTAYTVAVKDIVEAAAMGFSGTVFAYGNTGSGKTHSILGDAASLEELSRQGPSQVPIQLPTGAGILPRMCVKLFESIAQLNCVVRLSYLEIYNEELKDLLAPSGAPVGNLRIRSGEDGPEVSGLVTLDFEDPYEMIKAICKCAERRKTAETQLNAASSRSHTICVLAVKERCRNEFGVEGFFQRGKLSIVDLAGSENIGKSGVTLQGQKEAGTINQSLLALGRVITALNEGSSHIPYRDSNLTRLLQESIGGSTRTIMIANIGPGVASVGETLNTLTYASGVRKIQNKPIVNTEFVKNVLNQKEAEVASLKTRLESVKRIVESQRLRASSEPSPESMEQLWALLHQHSQKVDAEITCFEQKTIDMRATFDQSCVEMQEFFAAKAAAIADSMREAMDAKLEEQRKVFESYAGVDTEGMRKMTDEMRQLCEKLKEDSSQQAVAAEADAELRAALDFESEMVDPADSAPALLFQQAPRTPSRSTAKTPTRSLRKAGAAPMTPQARAAAAAPRTPGSVRRPGQLPNPLNLTRPTTSLKSRLPATTPLRQRAAKAAIELAKEANPAAGERAAKLPLMEAPLNPETENGVLNEHKTPSKRTGHDPGEKSAGKRIRH